MSLKIPKSKQPIPKNAKRVFKGEIFEIWQWQQTMFDGSVETFEKAKRNASVGIIAITPDKKIVVTKQEQPSIESFVGLLGGVVDDGELVREAAKRELMEEAGLEAQKLDLWYSAQPVTKIEWPIYIFIAKNCKQVSEQNLDSGEKIELMYLNWDDFLNLVVKDNFRDREITFKFLEAMRSKKSLEKIKKLFFD